MSTSILRSFPDRRLTRLTLCTAPVFFAACLAVIRLAGLFSGSFPSAVGGALAFTLLFLPAALFLGTRCPDGRTLFFGLCFLALALLLRVMCLEVASRDYTQALSVWMRHFEQNGGFRALADNLGDYNVPYLYFLSAISYLPIRALYLIKLLSIVFDLLLAVFACKIAKVLFKSRVKAVGVFFAVLFWPTVWLNSAYWAQCDSIYVCFILAALYCILKDKILAAVVLSALAFSFKLQTIFFLPLFLVLLLAKRIRWQQLLAFPAVYFLTIVPALLFGRPLGDILMIYVKQSRNYAKMSLGAPSAYTFISGTDVAPEPLKWVGILTAAAFVLAVCYLATRPGVTLSDKAIFLCAAVFVIGVPWLLPAMHERYFFGADVLTLLYGLYRRRYFVPALSLAASYTGSHSFLFLGTLMDFRLASLCMLLALGFVVFDFLREIRPQTALRSPDPDAVT